MHASIVIPTCDEGIALLKTVESCLETAGGLDCEVVVADDASRDGSPEEVKRRYPQVRLTRHAARRGVSQTKDLGARAARGEVLVFLDAHCKPEPGALAALIGGVEEWRGEAVISPRIAHLDVRRWETDLGEVGHGYAVSLEDFGIGWVKLEDMPVHGGSRFRRQGTFVGCVAALGRALYDRLWGFDTGMQVYGSEDIDLGVRSWMMGYPVLHDPGPVVGHRFRDSGEEPRVPERYLLANSLRMARKVFTDGCWFAWVNRASARWPAAWDEGWQEFLAGYESVERERAYLMANRRHDEYWYAATFGQHWPRAAGAAGAAGGAAALAGGVAAGGVAPELGGELSVDFGRPGGPRGGPGSHTVRPVRSRARLFMEAVPGADGPPGRPLVGVEVPVRAVPQPNLPGRIGHTVRPVPARATGTGWNPAGQPRLGHTVRPGAK